MQLKVLGAAGTVTGSSYVLTSQSGQSIMIDLGMFQGPSEIESLNHKQFEYDCSQLSGVLLTHAHLDHCGRLPILFKKGFREQIRMTSATLAFVELSLFDSARIAQKEPKKALYDEYHVEKTLSHSRTVEYNTPFTIGDFQVTYRDAGHLLGSASIEIEDTTSTGQIKKIVFSGDLGNYPQDLLNPTEFHESADAVVMESTYGDRLHPKGDPVEDLYKELRETESTGKALLIPSFALEKTQVLLHMIKHLKLEGRVSHQLPVYLDSPMAQKATEIHTHFPEICNEHLQKELQSGDPFDFPGLKMTVGGDESRDIHSQPGAKVIIAGGGMMTGGRILFHAKHYLPSPANRIFFVGYQGEETIGREILEGKNVVKIDGVSVDINAQVNSTKSMSSHADQGQLLKWLRSIKGVNKVFLTHGEELSRAALAEKINSELGITDIVLPYLNQEISF